MFNSVTAFFHHGKRYIPDPTQVTLPDNYTGKPIIESTSCINECVKCHDVCPTNAISIKPVQIRLDKCIFCLECQDVCPQKKIRFTNQYKISSNAIKNLLITEGNDDDITFDTTLIRKEIMQTIGRSLKLRLVSAGSCNGCELELNAAGNVNFDMGRYGIDFVASPRHADGLVIVGPITENSLNAVNLTYKAIPSPKIVILVGTCALSGGLFENSPALRRDVINEIKPDLFIPGCPPHPLTFINGVLSLIKNTH